MEKVKIYTDTASAQKQKRNTLVIVDAINDAISELSQLGVCANDAELMQFLAVPNSIISTAIESEKSKFDAFYENYPESDRPSYNGEPVLRARIQNIHRRLSHKIPHDYDRNNALYHIDNGVCKTDDNIDEALDEKYSVYCENENQLAAYKIASEICEKIDELSKVSGKIPPICEQYMGVVEMHLGTNGTPTINFGLISNIK